MPGRLVLCRHGQSIWNLQNLFTGWTDVDLTEQGRAEAICAGREVRNLDFAIDIAYTSVLKRAIRTLWLMLDEMDRMWIPVIRDWRLNERHYGALQGLDKAETSAKYGADQVLVSGGRLFDKPEDTAAARAQLMALRGRSHQLLSAAVIALDGAAIWRHVGQARLTMRLFSDAFLDDYLTRIGDLALTSVGCYHLEGLGAQLFARVEGDYFTVLGLPLLELLGFLRAREVLIE